MAQHFEKMEGNRLQRVLGCVQTYIAPLTASAVTSFLGVVLLSAAIFTYFKIYYFQMICVSVAICFMNGVILTPLLLATFGTGEEGSMKAMLHAVHKVHPEDDGTRKVQIRMSQTVALPVAINTAEPPPDTSEQSAAVKLQDV
eukprot:TRINITY_DN5351_c0_g1_i1.p1 TRINITY_DN5351_c0_g1~~TRINITY_DN5351_c0_g1_i1.p1  ORF type:complete len:143 (+),score=25.92 TRINITY_DN5351_c0_g1_i1:482-910(+)